MHAPDMAINNLSINLYFLPLEFYFVNQNDMATVAAHADNGWGKQQSGLSFICTRPGKDSA